MSDAVLKELLKEEKYRRSKSDKSRKEHKQGDRKNPRKEDEGKGRVRRSDKREGDGKEHKERDHRKDRSRHRSKSEGNLIKREMARPSPEPIDTREKFMFVYEDEEGNLYTSISKITLSEEKSIKIFPVYFVGSNENLTEEVVKYIHSKLTPSEENTETTWLSIINSNDENIFVQDFDLEDIVVYNGKFFHCSDDLIYYINTFGCDYLSIFKPE